MTIYDDEGNVQLRRKMMMWDKRIASANDETLMYIIQSAEYEMNLRHEKEDIT
jgi:hypothetical protein